MTSSAFLVFEVGADIVRAVARIDWDSFAFVEDRAGGDFRGGVGGDSAGLGICTMGISGEECSGGGDHFAAGVTAYGRRIFAAGEFWA